MIPLKKFLRATNWFLNNLKGYFSDDKTQVSEEFGKSLQNKTYAREKLDVFPSWWQGVPLNEPKYFFTSLSSWRTTHFAK